MKTEANNSILKSNLLQVHLLQLQNCYFALSPPVFHLFHPFEAQQYDIKYSDFIAEELEGFWDLEISIYFFTSYKSFEILCIWLNVFSVTKQVWTHFQPMFHLRIDQEVRFY